MAISNDEIIARLYAALTRVLTTPALRRNFQLDLKIIHHPDRHYSDRHFSEAFELVEVSSGQTLGTFATYTECLQEYHRRTA